MKIGIMGAHGTGKTTLAAEIAGYYAPLAVVLDEGARACPYPINKEMALHSQRWIFARQIAMEHYAEDASVVVCDRTVLDGLAYTMWMLEITNNKAMADFLGVALPFALNWFETYDLVIWCRPDGGPLQDDGVRDLDPSFQGQVDQVFARLVAGYGLKYVESDNVFDPGWPLPLF